MNPKEKAKEIFNKYHLSIKGHGPMVKEQARTFALLTVDEILSVVDRVYYHDANMLVPYWNEVKREIEKII